MKFIIDHLGALSGGGVAAFGAAWLFLKDIIKEWWMDGIAARRMAREVQAAQAGAGGKALDSMIAIFRQEQADCKAQSEKYFSILMAQGANIQQHTEFLKQLVDMANKAHDDLSQIKGAVGGIK